jgi:ferredoxin-NADP reductase
MKVILVKKKNEARSTKSFFFEAEQQINFLPGQYMYYTLSKLNYKDDRGATRQFTIASSPTENGQLRLTTRIRQESGFKKTLNELPIGSVIKAEGPEGTLIFEEEEKGPQIFLAGGIGITPFRSMIKYVVDKNIDTPIYLIYSNSDGDIVFKKEFDEIAKKNPNIKVRYVISGTEGHLDQEKIETITTAWKLDQAKPTWWICGPPPFIDAMEAILSKMKVSSGQIRSEKFTGY